MLRSPKEALDRLLLRRSIGSQASSTTPATLSLPPNAAAAIMEDSDDGILVADLGDPAHRLTYVNRAFERITGYQREEAIGKNCRYLQGSDRLQPEIAEIRAAISARAPVDVTLRNYRKDGGLFWNALRLLPIFDEEGRATHYIARMRDITATRRITDQLHWAERFDLLTGSLNRYAFVQKLDELIEASEALCLVVKIDIARFDEINSGYGYETGDALLVQIARRLDAVGAALVARTGGNEFAAACMFDRDEEAEAWLEKIGTVLRQRYALPGARVDLRFATGYAVGAPGCNALSLIRQAGTALHRSKGSRLRETQKFDERDFQQARQRMRLTSELQQAVAEKEFLFNYQPKFDLRTGALVGAEALLRWNHGLFGVQSPDRFIGVAEETGLILDNGEWGRGAVARFAAQINRGRATPIRFSLNVSAVELTHGDLVSSVARAIEESDADPAWLTLELTETLMAEDTPAVLTLFQRLRDLGVGLSVDDFGMGYSNLRYIERFPLSEIKVDKHFIRDIQNSPAKQIIVAAVVDLGRELALDIVAEGIETIAERETLQSMNCPYGQGYLLGRPISDRDFGAFLASR
jgi:PAS domain S-box-containing protein/diguanylate cyclase (GGDEF)-like protein